MQRPPPAPPRRHSPRPGARPAWPRPRRAGSPRSGTAGRRRRTSRGCALGSSDQPGEAQPVRRRPAPRRAARGTLAGCRRRPTRPCLRQVGEALGRSTSKPFCGSSRPIAPRIGSAARARGLAGPATTSGTPLWIVLTEPGRRPTMALDLPGRALAHRDVGGQPPGHEPLDPALLSEAGRRRQLLHRDDPDARQRAARGRWPSGTTRGYGDSRGRHRVAARAARAGAPLSLARPACWSRRGGRRAGPRGLPAAISRRSELPRRAR